MNVLITGVSGSGKTTIAQELTKRGYNAQNMDKIEGLCAWINISTGKPDPNFKRKSADDWLDKYDWLWDERRLKQLLKESGDAFFCGSSGNQKEFYHLFDKVFLLEMDEQLIKDRILANERDHDYGKRPGEIEVILGYFESFQEEAIAQGAIIIDAHQSIDEIADQIVAKSKV